MACRSFPRRPPDKWSPFPGASAALDLITNLDADDDDEDETQAESVAPDTASEYVTLDSDDYTIKLKRTGSGSILRSFATARPVLTRGSITLQAGSVYSFFMTDNGVTPIGVLRRDR